MHHRIKSILFVIGVIIVFTAQANHPDNNAQHGGGQHASAPHATGRNAAPHQNPVRTQTQTRRIAPQQTARRTVPVVQPRVFQRSRQDTGFQPHVYGIPVPKDARPDNNRLFHRQHHKHWQPIYNFYDNQYHFYPYIDITSPVELSADVVAIVFNGQTYYYDQGSFYIQDPQGYLATPPPIGIVVGVLPPNARQITTDAQVYYRYKGVCYVRVEQGYQVIDQLQPVSDS